MNYYPSLADGQDNSPLIGDFTCGSAIKPTSRLLDFSRADYVSPSSGKLPRFIAGTIKDPDGGRFSTIYVEGTSGWKAFPVEEQASFAHVFVSPDVGRALLFSMIDQEGPGQSYVVASTADGFKTLRCSSLPAPNTRLDILDFMQIKSFALDAQGKGKIEGIVEYSDERPADCFVSETADGGQTWSVPEKTSSCIASIYQEATKLEDGQSVSDEISKPAP